MHIGIETYVSPPRDFYQVNRIADKIRDTLNPRIGLRDEVKALQDAQKLLGVLEKEIKNLLSQ